MWPCHARILPFECHVYFEIQTKFSRQNRSQYVDFAKIVGHIFVLALKVLFFFFLAGITFVSQQQHNDTRNTFYVKNIPYTSNRREIVIIHKVID